MCGIAGIVGGGPGAVAARDLERLRDAQRHRGPDASGCWIAEDRSVGLAHRRLSIIDLSALGEQPMATSDGRFRITYNGEIYNYRELRCQLEGLGYAFRSDSDTEVVLVGFREWGLEVLDRMVGMFAFAIHDAESGEIVVARDPLGIKPLYYGRGRESLIFSSELRALRTLADDGGISPEGLATYLLWGSIAPPRTLWRNLHALPAGCWMRIRGDAHEEPVRYFRIEDEFSDLGIVDPREAAAALREALLASARRHAVADVPVGAFLSGGVDSSALVGLLSEVQPSPIRTVTLGFDVAELDEREQARAAAKLYQAHHTEVPIRIDEVRERITEAVDALDQPSIDGVNSFFVAEAAARSGLKVAVSGVGGDELFGGYPSFERVPRLVEWSRRIASLPGAGPLMRGMAGAAEALPRNRLSSKIALALAYGGDWPGAYFADRGIFSPAEVRALLAPEIRSAVDAVEPRGDLAARVDVDGIPAEDRVCAMEFRQFLQVQLLRDIDAVSMRHSLEVRTPLVDVELLRTSVRVRGAVRRAGPAKAHLRNAPRPPLPTGLWQRPKRGFTLPFESWLRAGRIPLDLPRSPMLDTRGVGAVARRFERRRAHWSRLWALLVLDRYLD